MKEKEEISDFYEEYNINFEFKKDSLITTIISQDSQIFESKKDLIILKKNKILESIRDISEIINYLYFSAQHDDCSIKLEHPYLIFTIKIKSSLDFFHEYLKKNPKGVKSAENIHLKIPTHKGDKNEINIKDENEIVFICNKKEKIQDDIESLYEFFSCIKCKKIVSNAHSCKCSKLICFKCLKDYSNKDCSFSPNYKIDSIVSNLFENEKLKKEKINFYILKKSNLKELFLKDELHKIVNPDWKNLTPEGSLDFIENLTNEEIIDQFKDLENNLTPCNLLDLVSTVGSLVNNYINSIKKSYSSHFIDVSNALKSKKNPSYFIAGIMAKFLSDQGINVAIKEKSSSKTLTKSLLDWLLIGLLKFRKLVLHLDYGEEKNNNILNCEEEQEKLIQYWKNKITENLGNIDLYPISIKKGSLELSFATSSDLDVSSLNTLIDHIEVKDIKFNMLLEGCIISLEMFDSRWNNSGSGWAGSGERRGGEKYYPPTRYDGYGLKVSKQYDNNDDTWLGMENKIGEWWVAYHGAGRNRSDEETKEIIQKIMKDGFISGPNQRHLNEININQKSNRVYETVGKGVYLSNKIDVAEEYAGKVRDEDGNEYKIVFMCRVCPEKVRISRAEPDYYVLDPNKDCIRPYRILLRDTRNIRNNSSCLIY